MLLADRIRHYVCGSGPLIGGFDPLIRGSYDFGTLPTWCYAIFQTVFCAAAATIVSGSTVAMTADADMELASLVMFNTNLAAAVATVVGMIFTWIRYGKPDVSITFNAALAGLVAITAPCDCVTPAGAFFIGLIAGFLVVLAWNSLTT